MKQEEEFKLVEKLALDLFSNHKDENPHQKNQTVQISSDGLGNFEATIEKINEKEWRLKSYIKIF